MNRSVSARSKRRDRVARRVITCGGLLIVASVIAILFMIAQVALPLFMPASARLTAAHPLPALAPDASATATAIRNPQSAIRNPTVLAIGSDEYRENGFALDDRATLTFMNLATGALLDRQTLKPPTSHTQRLAAAENQGANTFLLHWDDGSLTVEKVKFAISYDGARHARRLAHSVERFQTLAPPPDGPPLRATARLAEDGKLTRVELLSGGKLAATQLTVTEDLLGEKTSETKHIALSDDLPSSVTALAVDQSGRVVYAGLASGELMRWRIEDPDKPELTDRVHATNAAITALGFVLGDISLAVGDARGGLATWFVVNTGYGRGSLKKIHHLSAIPAAITYIMRSPRNKSILSLDAAGQAHLDHMTSERRLANLKTARPLRLTALTPRNDGILALDDSGAFLSWSLNAPHPEVSFKTLFGKVWYENYAAPAWVWQSTSGSDDFEPKLSLAPLIYGTLKGTLYALLLAAPLAILAALYTSQFMRPELRRIVKPAVEIMSAIPSVVIGFLAALWLAPRVEGSILGVFLSLALIPACLLATLFLWQFAERLPVARKLAHGHEFLLLIPVIVAGGALAFWLGPVIERAFFGGHFAQWLFSDLGVRYDQRNSIIIAVALGFAVIPIIFTIADDSMTNIPRSLTAASLALGASRWQTAWRVVLPSASPGIFAAVMIGLGRAVGETMIVLMATGNTPIMDPSPFNGMRTLSANIAVEIPEAPVGGTLYRVLFLTAVLLFLMTFALNTAAEVVRQRLRRKYGQL